MLTTKIAVAGATGRVGRHTVEVLRERGHEVVEIARSKGVDLVTGEGLAAALAGVDTIIDASSGSSPDQQSATDFFTSTARQLQSAGQRAGVKRIVVVSIIGIDRFTSGYPAAKVVHERVLTSGPIPVRILRAAQFHEFVSQIVDWGRRGDVSYVPRMRTQLVAALTVAEKLADLALDPAPIPAAGTPGATIDIAGPKVENMVDAATRLAARRGEPARIEGATNPADPDSALYESGALLPGPKAILAGPTFDEWLQLTVPEVSRAR